MTSLHQVYKCSVCGNVVEVVHTGAGTLVCCGKPMQLFTENTVEASKEKHIPVVSKTAEGFKVTVGSALHPMEEQHYIEWIELLVGDHLWRKYLHPGDPPEALFCVDAAEAVARAYCNIHGLWRS
ncbi:MAG: desulfoferrodoxin [Moorellaceae bacterium]